MATRSDLMVLNTNALQILKAIREVVGKRMLNDLLTTANLERFIKDFPPDNLDKAMEAREFAKLNEIIETTYSNGGDIQERIGKATFQQSLREQTALLNLAARALRLIPKNQRIPFILTSVADANKKTNPCLEIWVEEKEGLFAYIDATCMICHGRRSSQPICYLTTGILSEAVHWATGDELTIIETHCIGKGDTFCRYIVENTTRKD